MRHTYLSVEEDIFDMIDIVKIYKARLQEKSLPKGDSDDFFNLFNKVVALLTVINPEIIKLIDENVNGVNISMMEFVFTDLMTDEDDDIPDGATWLLERNWIDVLNRLTLEVD